MIWYLTKLDSFSVQCLGQRDYDSLLFYMFELVIKTAWCRPAFNPMHLALANFVGYGENWKVEFRMLNSCSLQWWSLTCNQTVSSDSSAEHCSLFHKNHDGYIVVLKTGHRDYQFSLNKIPCMYQSTTRITVTFWSSPIRTSKGSQPTPPTTGRFLQMNENESRGKKVSSKQACRSLRSPSFSSRQVNPSI